MDTRLLIIQVAHNEAESHLYTILCDLVEEDTFLYLEDHNAPDCGKQAVYEDPWVGNLSIVDSFLALRKDPGLAKMVFKRHSKAKGLKLRDMEPKNILAWYAADILHAFELKDLEIRLYRSFLGGNESSVVVAALALNDKSLRPGKSLYTIARTGTPEELEELARWGEIASWLYIHWIKKNYAPNIPKFDTYIGILDRIEPGAKDSEEYAQLSSFFIAKYRDKRTVATIQEAAKTYRKIVAVVGFAHTEPIMDGVPEAWDVSAVASRGENENVIDALNRLKGEGSSSTPGRAEASTMPDW